MRDGLRQVLSQKAIPITVRYLPHATLADLGRALTEPYDVLHFVSHGTEDGSLLLEREDGTADPIGPAALAETLRGADVRLALLSACYSAKAGLALQAGGIPDVVMVDEAWPMDARAAALFNGSFYTWLARGRRPREAFNAGVRAVKGDAQFGTRGEQPADPDTGERALLLGAVPGVHGRGPATGCRRAGGRVPRGASAAGGVHGGGRRHLCGAREGAD